jgi:hypothetical protein
VRAVGGHARLDVAADLGTDGQQLGQRRQHRRADRQIGVGDELEATQGLGHQRRGAERGHPAQLHLRQAAALGEAAQREGQRGQRGVWVMLVTASGGAAKA